MANYSVDQLTQALISKGGYNPTDARNAAENKGGRADDLAREFLGVSTAPGAPSTSGGSSFDVITEAKKIQEFNVAANQPVIQTLLAGKTNLTDRYNKLIEDIKGRRASTLKTTDIGLSREFGKRGIPLSSGAFDVALQEARLPVEQTFGGLESEAVGELGERLSAMDLAKAQLETGNPASAFELASRILSGQATQKISERELELKEAEAAKPGTQIVEAGGRKLLVNSLTGQTIKDLGAATSGSTGTATERSTAGYLKELRQAVGQGLTVSDALYMYGDTLGFSDIVNTYNRYSIYGPAQEPTQDLYKKFSQPIT